MGKPKLTTEEVRNAMWELVGDEYTMLSEYVNATTPIIVRHNKCKREYPVRWNNFKHGKRCALCRGVLKHTIEEAREAFDKLNLTLLTEEYTHALYPMEYICRTHPEEGVQKGTLSAILGGHVSCKKCRYTKAANSQKKSFEEVFQLFDEHELDLIDTEYINSTTPMNYICRKHPELGVQQITVDNLSHNKHSGCQRCGYEAMGENKRMSDEEIVQLFDEHDFDVVEIIKTRRTKVKCICRKHKEKGIQVKTLYGLKNQGKGCKYCANVVPLTQEEVEDRVHNKNPNVDVVSKYINGESPLTLKCKVCGCQWTTRAENATSRKRGRCGCPCCDGSFGVRQIYSFLTSHNFKFDMEYKFPDLFGYATTQLRFDFAILGKDDEVLTLIEFDGQHHYFPVDYRGEGMDEAIRRHKNCVKYDKKKNAYCKKNELTLIRIPYWKVYNIEKILTEKLL